MAMCLPNAEDLGKLQAVPVGAGLHLLQLAPSNLVILTQVLFSCLPVNLRCGYTDFGIWDLGFGIRDLRLEIGV